MLHKRCFAINVCNIFTDNKLPELFDCLSNVELLRLLLFCVADEEPSHISVAVFCTEDNFLNLVIKSDNIRVILCIIYVRFVLFFYFFLYQLIVTRQDCDNQTNTCGKIVT